MGTRADFYVGRGESAEWLGSIAWDGNPESIDLGLLAADTEQLYRERVTAFLAGRDDATPPGLGWPWPWDDGHLTDYSYAFDAGVVYASSFGHEWFRVDPDASCFGEPEYDSNAPQVPFPDMSARKSVALGRRSGVVVFDGRTGRAIQPED